MVSVNQEREYEHYDCSLSAMDHLASARMGRWLTLEAMQDLVIFKMIMDALV
jgi:hypothetical protein